MPKPSKVADIFEQLRTHGTVPWQDEDKPAEEAETVKEFYTMTNIGTAKYVVNFHDGEKTCVDGSKFFDLKTFKNKKALAAFVSRLRKAGYKEV